ncbi:MAG TPA: hypothetical protein ENK11_03365 [Phycisphaerales bacterium]|nr:hypothetical protein [Phycisphaerales bacterium]
MPNDPEHRIYVWIEALCNYLTVVDEPERRKHWPKPGTSALRAESGVTRIESNRGSGELEDSVRRTEVPNVTHLMAKDILWFHAVIWPCMLHALGEEPPRTVYAHAYWISEGRKMSKSLGNFIEIDRLRLYAEKYSLDALRWFLTTQGPLGATDADFAHARFVEVYNAELANGIGNAASRVGNMIVKYFDGVVPACSKTGFTTESTEGHGEEYKWDEIAVGLVGRAVRACEEVRLDDSLRAGLELSNRVDAFIAATRPFSIAKEIDKGTHADPARGREDLNTILYQSAEALRIASLLLWPAMPSKMAELWRNWDCSPLNDPDDPDSGFRAPLSELATWAHPAWGMKPGSTVRKGEPLFMRADAKEPAPGDAE